MDTLKEEEEKKEPGSKSSIALIKYYSKINIRYTYKYVSIATGLYRYRCTVILYKSSEKLYLSLCSYSSFPHIMSGCVGVDGFLWWHMSLRYESEHLHGNSLHDTWQHWRRQHHRIMVGTVSTAIGKGYWWWGYCFIKVTVIPQMDRPRLEFQPICILLS